MRRSCSWIGRALCLCASLAVSARYDAGDGGWDWDDDMILDVMREDATQPETGTEPAAAFLRCNKAAWRIPGQYLVMLDAGSHESHVQRTINRLTAKAARRGYLLEILKTYTGVLHGFLVKMSSDVLHMAVRLPHVHYIEEDSSIFAQSAPWNLQRLLQPHGVASENGTYRPPNDGGEAEVYLMDGSVQSSHRELEGRARLTDFSSVPEEDGVRVHRQASQCDSHGTHVAGVVSGSDSGVARGAAVNLVRVLNCQGKGTVSGALAGMDYIRAALSNRPVNPVAPVAPVVILLPFIGGFSRSLNTASRDMVARGAVVIAAAGNQRDDACFYSPASEPEVITVAAVNLADQLMSLGAGGTNFGRCVDLFAPGDDIVSASSDCATCFTPRSGTSQAAAHAAGIAAVLLSSNGNMSPAQLLQTMLRYSVRNGINFLPLPEAQRLVTPNLVAAVPAGGGGDDGKGRELLCRSVWSERSGVKGEDRAVSRCRLGEEMTSCRSFSADGLHAGETVAASGQQMECVAHNGVGGSGVHAVARCCVIGGLRCRVHVSPEAGRDAECVEPQHHLTGCSTWSKDELLSHSRPHHGDRRRCIGKAGMTSHAVCCHAPALECHLVEKTSADKEEVELSCTYGWTMTDCSAVSQGAALLGSGAEGNSCRVRRPTGAGVAAGVAVCCRVTPPEGGDTSGH